MVRSRRRGRLQTSIQGRPSSRGRLGRLQEQTGIRKTKRSTKKLEKEIKKVVSFIETHSIRGKIAGKDQIGAEERTFFDNAPSVSLM